MTLVEEPVAIPREKAEVAGRFLPRPDRAYCSYCAALLTPLNWPESRRRIGHRQCRKCNSAYNRARFQKGWGFGTDLYWANRVQRWRQAGILGFTRTDFELMLTEQGGLCGFCRSPVTTITGVPDHDRSTGRVRAVVCKPCNRTLINCHTVESARQLVAYLEAHACPS